MYIETTVPSYLTARPSRDVVRAGEQQITRDWWARRSDYELRVSSLVLLECGAGDPSAAALRLAALDGVPALAQIPAAEELAAALLREAPLPARAAADALHIAVAAVHGISYFGDLELRAHRQCIVAASDRSRLSTSGVRAAGHLHAEGIARRGGGIMSDVDILKELRAWRDEFARSHGYDLRAMASALRELDEAAGARVVRGEPRRPVVEPAPVGRLGNERIEHAR